MADETKVPEPIVEEDKEEEKPQSLLDVALTGQEVPERYQGKPLKDVLRDTQSLEERLAEKDRELQRLRVAQQAPPPAQPQYAPQSEPRPPGRSWVERFEGGEYEETVSEKADAAARQRVAELYSQRVAPLTQMTARMSIAAQRKEVEQEEDWDEHKEKVEAFLGQLNPEFVAQPGSYMTALNHERGRRMGEKRREAAVQKKMGAGGERPTPQVAPPVSKPRELTPEEAKWAAMGGMTPEEYLEEQKKL